MHQTFKIVSMTALLLCTTAWPAAYGQILPQAPSSQMGPAAGQPTAAAKAAAPAPAVSLAQATRPRGAGATNNDPTGPGQTGGASGISPNPANDTTGDVGFANPPVTESGRPRVGLFPEFGARLLNLGIDIHGAAFDRFLANPTAGVQPGHTYNFSAISPAADIDLQRLIGLPGGNLHTEFTFFALRSNIPGIAFQTGGAITALQTTPAVSSVPNSLSYFTYEQKLLGDRLSIEVGRTNPFRYFELPNSIDPFTYFSTVFAITADINSPKFPTWGGRVSYKLTPELAIQGAAFADNFAKSGLKPDALGEGPGSAGTNGVAGVQTFVSLEYRQEFSNAAYPANAELGLEWNTRHGLYNVRETAAPANARDEATDYHGGGVLFAQGQKVVWRGAATGNGPPKNIAVYGQIDTSLDKPEPFDFDALAGVNFTGFIPGRPFDVLEFQTRYQRLSQIEANFETLARNLFNRNIGPRQARDAYQFEAVANVQATPWLSIRPYAEAFIHPDSFFANAETGRARSGFEFGVFGRVTFGQLLGTSTKPF